MSYFDKPQRLLWRKALFQVHLWAGVVLALYVALIGLTGSILVFKMELARLSYPELFRAPGSGGPQNDLNTFIQKAQAAYPSLTLVTAYVPGTYGENAFAYMSGKEQMLYVFGDPYDGHVVGDIDVRRDWLTWVGEFHIRLLGGQTGYLINGIGAALLVLLSITGLILWWPGVKTWTRALKVRLRGNWKRTNFDLHSAAGFWTLSIVLLWSVSAVYFVWPKALERLVNHVSSVATATEPEIKLQSLPGSRADLRTLIANAQTAAGGSKLTGIYLPAGDVPIEVYLARERLDNFSETDRVYLHPVSGEVLAVWHSGINPTLGSKFLYWLGPLHFGVYWGLGIKSLWAALGLTLPVLAITGVLMYWNRSLNRYWQHFRRRPEQNPASKGGEGAYVDKEFTGLKNAR